GHTITSTFYLDNKPRTVDNGTKTNKYAYDGSGQTVARADVTDIGGVIASTTTYSFGDAEVATQMKVTVPNVTTTNWSYNQLGQQTREDVLNAQSALIQYTTQQYNPDNSLFQKFLNNAGGSAINSWKYFYDANNQIIQQATPSLTTNYAYDTSNRVCYYAT